LIPSEVTAAFKKHLEALIEVSDSELDFILSFFEFRKFKKHQFLIQKGGTAEYSYWLYEGLTKSFFTDEAGKEHILQFAMEDWWTSDYESHFNELPATLDVDCIENTMVLCISYQNREKLCAQMHKMEYFFRKKANSGYIALQKRFLNSYTNNTKERYELLLKQYPSLFQRVPKAFIASYLGVSRETLSRLQDP
jgi:CRP-like cAMP-binding protein